MAAYDFTSEEFADVWDAFHAHADAETHFLSVADLQATLALLDLYETDEDVTWFIKHVNAVETGKLSFIKLVKGVGDLIDKKGRKKRGNPGRRFNWREIAELFRLFMSIDVDKSGEISFSELYKALRLINPRAKVNDVLSMFSVLDVDKSHAIDFPEFVRGISLGGEAISGPIVAPEATSAKPRTTKTASYAKDSTFYPTVAAESSEIFRNVDGGVYAREASSPHFPTMTKRSTSLPKPRALELENPYESTPPTSASRMKTDRATGSRLYNNWAAKNAKPPPVLDQRVPNAISSTRPSYFPNNERAPSSFSPSSSSSSSPTSSSFPSPSPSPLSFPSHSPPFSSSLPSKPPSPSKSYRFPPL